MIRWHHQHQRVFLGFGNFRCQQNGCCSVPTHRFIDDRQGCAGHFDHLTVNNITVALARYDDWISKVRMVLNSANAVLEQGQIIVHFAELLWQIFAGNWPQSCAFATCENNRDDFGRGHVELLNAETI